MSLTSTSGKAVRAALFFSAALNLVLVSAIAVHFFREYNEPQRRPAPQPAFGIERMAGRLPKPDADLLRKAYAQHENDVKAAQANLREARRSVRTALEAEPFSADAVKEAMSKMDDGRDQLQNALQAVFTSAAAEMSREGRVKLAQGPGRNDRPQQRRDDRNR
jgi:uncharacterized membrane protein